MSQEDYLIQSVLRSLDVLIWLAEHDGAGRITDIASDLGCSKNTAFRLMQTLIARDFVRQTDDSSYELTLKLLFLGESVLRRMDVHHVARPFLQSLASLTGETTTLAILDGDEVVYLDRVLGRATFTTSFTVGSRAKAHTTSLGKAILAFSDNSVIARYLEGDLNQNTPYTLANPQDLKAELHDITTKFYAIDNQENVLGVRCLGAPIFNRHGHVVAGISLAGLAAHITDQRIQELVEPLRDTAYAISSHLGYRDKYGPAVMGPVNSRPRKSPAFIK